MAWERKTERINIRVSKEEKKIIERAVEKSNKERMNSWNPETISSFLINQAKIYLNKKI